MSIIKIEHRSKIECYPSFSIKIQCKNNRDFVLNCRDRVNAFLALGFEI